MKYAGELTNAKAHLSGYGNCDHVPLDELTELDARVVLASNKIHWVIDGKKPAKLSSLVTT